jgi:hypothetical protein
MKNIESLDEYIAEKELKGNLFDFSSLSLSVVKDDKSHQTINIKPKLEADSLIKTLEKIEKNIDSLSNSKLYISLNTGDAKFDKEVSKEFDSEFLFSTQNPVEEVNSVLYIINKTNNKSIFDIDKGFDVDLTLDRQYMTNKKGFKKLIKSLIEWIKELDKKNHNSFIYLKTTKGDKKYKKYLRTYSK